MIKKTHDFFYKHLNMSKDFLWNIMASLVATGVLQLLVYPILARNYDKSFYGVILTSMGIINTLAVSFGNSLNNSRLVTLDTYNEEKSEGDYNVLLLYTNVLVSVAIIILGISLFEFDVYIVLGTLLLSSLLVFRSYLVVLFRIRLDFKAFFYNSLLLAIGYAIGSLLILIIDFWPIPFIVGEIFALLHLYIFFKPKQITIKKTRYFKFSLNKSSILIITTILGNALIYMDRILLYPILGSESVSVYTVASFFGKTLGIVAAPMAGVLLSYYSSKNFVMNKKKYLVSSYMIFISSIIFIPLIVIIAPFITRILYPTIYDDAKIYILWANIGALIIVVTRMMQPAIIKYAPTYWLLLKEGVYGITYIALSIVLIPKYSINGLIWVTIISASLKVVLMFFLGYYYILKKQRSLVHENSSN